ncbi:tRNA (adenosine(37)-N6)-threonylcarbamoyltransferase complex dimerization subunit type 1 TsaB [Nesterenkonia lutea]|uniref:tRNA threonylcarbamoyl adenosine modification protein YeaZ n=1 Tax=Nesterenkonia lutea TaxID=272919 RepID=A0ABR9JB00_9MICC|nr:tRNA (adenosine(37)-N6)-threonylcarbamoyltransferase complex dimerization subunit type 1 TsaB [Nesterenkonia lutea]MBE1523099.1 tRNA threonylcarbamoyl adenosine modification protein YeaZ [Nesterenkonia lutea]
MILAIDSSAGASVAVLHQSRVLAQWRTAETTTHAEVLASAVAETMRRAGAAGAELSGVVVGVGPGPFTGLRVGLALAHSLAEVWQVPLHGICSLDSLAHRAVTQPAPGAPSTPAPAEQSPGALSDPAQEEFLVATDARRREVYWARYRTRRAGSAAEPGQHPSAELIEGPHVSAAGELPDLPAVGFGASLYPEAVTARSATEASWLPDAVELAQVAELAQVTEGAQAAEVGAAGALRQPLPLYLRESDAKVPAQMRPRQAAQ